ERAVDPVPGATAAAIDPTQRVMAVGYTTGAVRLFVAGRPAGTGVSTGGACPVQHLAFVPGEPALAAIDKRGVLRVLDTDTLNVCFEYTVPVPPTCAGLIPGTSWLMVGTESGRVYFVDVVAGRKADFSVGCLSKPLSAVVAVEAHPVEAEKFLVAYASGECVVGDLGRAAGSEKAMVLSRHRLENPPDAGMAVVQLRAACWSPTGDRIAAAYSNGVVCVFGTGAGAGPVAAWAIPCPDARAANEAQLVPTGLRWCTHAQLDCSFLVAISQTAAGTESYVHTFGTKDRDAGVKSNRDVTDGGTATLDSSLLAIYAIPRASPWRGGNDGVRCLAALVGRPARVQLLEVLPTMGLRPSNELPDELEWCRVAPRIVHRAAGELNPGLGRFLAGTLRRGQLMAAGSPDVASQEAAAEPQAIARLYCCVDDSDVLSFWCAASRRLQRCHGLGLNLRQLARLAGVEGSVSSVSLCAKSGLLAVGMPGGEVLLALLTSDPWASLAQRYTPLDELREQAAAYYSTAAATGSRAPADDRAAHPAPPQDPQTIPDAVAEATEPTDMRASNPTTPHEARLLRRSSKRISASVGMLLRRASLIGDSDKGSRERRRTVAAGNDSRRHRMSLPVHRTRASAGADLGADLARPAVVASGDWSEQLGRLSAELSQMLCGMHFNRDEQQRIFGNVQADEASRPKPGAGAAPRIESTPRPYALPFMLARFVGRPITSLAASGDGLVAIAYACGALVVIDSGHQRVLLADNINMAPAADSSAASLFGGGHAQPASSVVAVAFSLPLDHGQLDATAGRSALQRTLLAGTSQGHVLEYAIGDQARPPRIIARPSADPIVYVWSDDGSGSGLGEASTLTAAEGATGVSRRPFLAASTSAVALYAGPGADPTAAYALPDTDAKLVAARV
ncbi:Syntaxin-binding protein 5, partial [Coemansia helicoidea]